MRVVLVGALGEVGHSVGAALTRLGHEVLPVSSRSHNVDGSVHSVESAARLIASGDVDLVVHAGGRGDKRGLGPDATGQVVPVTRIIGQACEDSGTRGVLISTVRVLESATEALPGSAPAQCHSDYARANAANETLWLECAPTCGVVLRLANYFCAPMDSDSPQTHLLPWSLVVEAMNSGAITVRSAPEVSREFVDAHDVAAAVITIATDENPAQVCSTIPGLHLSLAELTSSVCEAFTVVGRPVPTVSFGADRAGGPDLLPDWLAEHGWASTLTPPKVTRAIAEWLSEHASMRP